MLKFAYFTNSRWWADGSWDLDRLDSFKIPVYNRRPQLLFTTQIVLGLVHLSTANWWRNIIMYITNQRVYKSVDIRHISPQSMSYVNNDWFPVRLISSTDKSSFKGVFNDQPRLTERPIGLPSLCLTTGFYSRPGLYQYNLVRPMAVIQGLLYCQNISLSVSL